VGVFFVYFLSSFVVLYFSCMSNMVFYSALENFTAALEQHESTDSVKYVEIHSIKGFGTDGM